MWTYTSSFALVFGGYLVGSIPTALIIGKGVTGRDIRHNAFGNMGATNIFYSVGKLWGVITFIFDFLKGYIPTAFAWYLFANELLQGPWILAIATSTICGHNWPIWAHFHGGKGASTAAGICIASFPDLGFLLVPLLLIFLFLTHNISLAAGICYLLLPGIVFLGTYNMYQKSMSILVPLLFIPKLYPLFKKMMKVSGKDAQKKWLIIIHGFEKAKSFSSRKSSEISHLLNKRIK